MADGGPDSRGGQANEQGHQHCGRLDSLGVNGHRLQGDHGHQENKSEPAEQDVQRDLIGGFLSVGPLYQSDHAVEKGLARLGGDLDHDAVRQDVGAARDRAAVATGLADHGGRFTGDGRLVHGGDPLHHVAVARDDLARLDDAEVADLERSGRDLARGAVRPAKVGEGLAAGVTQCVGLGLAPALGHRFSEVGEDDGGP